MATAVKGLLHGKTITLDSTVPPFEGKRVQVVIEPVDEDLHLSPHQQISLWHEWVQRGPQGPISDDDADLP